jgi:hypothetical protein
MSNVNDFRRGATVRIREDAPGNYFPTDFPGWGTPNAADHLRPMTERAGQLATVTSVESHGSNPWTRYSIRFADGAHTGGTIPGVEFDWAPRS